MAREITTHHTNDVNKALKLTAIEDEKGEPADYLVKWYEADESGVEVELPFQHGPIKEVGVNGLTNEVLLAIVVDRLEFFQRGQFACEENADALGYVKLAGEALEARTKRRTDQGVEGTLQPDPKP
jgi:hypothetical protein